MRATSWSAGDRDIGRLGGLHTDRLRLWHLAGVRVRARLDERAVRVDVLREPDQLHVVELGDDHPGREAGAAGDAALVDRR